MRLRLMALVLPFLLPRMFAGEPTSPYCDVSGPAGARIRVEALDAGIVRVWCKPAGEFAREVSLATETAPTTRVPLTVTSSATQVAAATAVLRVEVDRATLRFTVRAEPSGATVLPASTLTPAPAGPGWTLTRALAPGERLLGLGQDNRGDGRLDRRGTVRELWDGQQINSGHVTAEYPVPLLLSLDADGRAYGVFFDNVHRLRFDLGATQPDTLRLDADGGEIDLYVLAGPRLADVLERYTRLTGRPALPPLWALGYWQSKCTYYDWRALDEAYAQLHARGFPVDVMVIDADWPEIVTDYRWAPRWLDSGKTPEEKIADYAQRGVRVVMSQSGPMVREDSPTFAGGWAAGVFATDGQNHPVECGYYGGKLLDFTSPAMNDWLWPQTRRLNEAGVAGWWLDLIEPEGEPPQTRYHAGGPAEVHNQYALLCERSFEGVQLAVHPRQRPFILGRAASAGAQRHHVAVWTGDIYSDYATLRAHPPEMLSTGLSGLPYWTCDTGGFLTGYYRDDQMGAHARLYERWMQFSAFSPIVRAHKAGGAPEPYQFGPATEQGTRHYLQLRYRLLPYIYSHAWEASRTGLPLVRPLALEFQDDPAAVAAPGDEYLFGRDLLVAPVLHEGQSSRKVYFPAGTWIDWDYGYDYAGGRDWVVAAPQNRIPVAVREGAIIPLAPDMLSTGEKPWDPLTLEIFPAVRSEFTLYRDDGISFGYEQGDCTQTRLACTGGRPGVTFTLAESNKRYTPREYRLRFHLRAAPTAVALDGAPLAATAWAWDEAARVLAVALEAGAALRHEVVVTLDERPLPARLAPELAEQPLDPQGEAAGAGNRPVPHFFPAPALPATILACNYDKGGEGVATHRGDAPPARTQYRDDDIGLRETAAAGGGFVLPLTQAGDWVCYSIDAGNGGWFDLTVRAAAGAAGGRFRVMALDRQLAAVDVPATGGDDVFREFPLPGVYLNPGVISLLVFADAPGFTLHSLSFARAAQPPAVYPAVLAARAGVVEVEREGGGAGRGAVRNLGRTGSSLTFGVVAGAGGEATLRLRYQNSRGKPLPYSLQVGDGPAWNFSLPPTEAGEWRDFPVRVDLRAGANAVVIRGLVDGWDSVSLEQLELVARP